MATFISVRRDIWKLPVTLVRWRTHFDPKHPRPPHFERAKFITATEPIYVRDTTPPQLKCGLVRYKKQTHRDPIPFESIMAAKTRKSFENYEFAAIYHLNQLFQDEVLDAQRLFFKNKLLFVTQATEILSLAVQNTKFSPLNHFFHCLKFDCVAFGKKSDVIKVLKLQKKTPKLILLGGVLEDRVMSRNDLVAYSKLPELPVARAQLCHTLSQAAQQTAQHLSYHQRNLSNLLQQHSKTENKE